MDTTNTTERPIECRLCGKRLRRWGGHLVLVHGVSLRDYLAEQSDRIDGPGLYRWIEAVDGLDNKVGRLGNHRARTLDRWKDDGAVANVYAVDKILVALGLQLSEVPSELYCAELQPSA
jgi:hypothetical protein